MSAVIAGSETIAAATPANIVVPPTTPMSTSTTSPTPVSPTPSPAPSSPATATPSTTGDWSCPACTLSNIAAATRCAACEKPRPSSSPVPAPSSASPSPSPASTSSSASPSSSSSAAKSKPASKPKSDKQSEKSDKEKEKEEEEELSKIQLKSGGSNSSTSSYYFFASTPKEQQHLYAPKPITPQEAPAPVARVGSVWNAAGTWEEMDMSDWATGHLKQLFNGVSVPNFSAHGTCKLVKCSKATGTASLVCTRGKIKAGFELNIVIDFSSEYKSEKVDGTIEIPNFEDCSEDDYSVSVVCKNSEVRQAMNKSMAFVRKQLAAFVTALREHPSAKR